ncbi:MAG: dihydrofolate reductase family protein [Anaerolineales bacterium]|nr:dihydrofolate reductase family protein [Anaerolineales bacterium]
MRKLIISTMATLDGVIENPQNWSFGYMSDEFIQYAREQLFATDMLVMGRVTYEGFSEAWSARAGSDDFADRINSLPKYVASRTLKGPLTWNANLIKGDIVKTIADLKNQSGGYILQYGSGELTRTLLQHGLIDELRLMVYPVAVGSGLRVFENIEQTPMKLLETKTFSTGVTILHYEPLKK